MTENYAKNLALLGGMKFTTFQQFNGSFKWLFVPLFGLDFINFLISNVQNHLI